MAKVIHALLHSRSDSVGGKLLQLELVVLTITGCGHGPDIAKLYGRILAITYDHEAMYSTQWTPRIGRLCFLGG